MNLPCILIVCCRSIGTDAARSVSGRAALSRICLTDGTEQKETDDGARHCLTPKAETYFRSLLSILVTR